MEQILSLVLATILSVTDGNTLKVKIDNRTVNIKLACIYAPTMNQRPWGEKSKRTLEQLAPRGQAIKIKNMRNRQGVEKVGEVFNNRININLEMVKKGQAVVYLEDMSDCNQTAYVNAENTAKRQKLGFWNQSNPIMPWDYRR
jgi:micrococcal nuclease